MKKIPKNIILDYNIQPPQFACEKCGARLTISLPAAINDFIKQGERFAASHQSCQNCTCGTGRGAIWCDVHKCFTGGLIAK